MGTLKELIKINIKENLDRRKFKENKKAQTFLASVLIFGILFLILSAFYNFIYIVNFKIMEAPVYVPIIFMGAFASIFTFSTSMFKIKSIFIGKDYEMLSAMPIKKSYILTSKLFALYIIELIYSAIIMVPNAIIIFLVYQNIIGALISLLSMILLPAIPMIISALFSLFVALVADRYKFGSVLNIILYTLMFAAIIFLSFSSSYNSSLDEENPMQIYMTLYNIFKFVNPSFLLIELSYELNPLFILLFIAGNILLTICVILFISLLFDKVHTTINTVKTNKKYIKKDLTVKGQFNSLFKLESKKYFGSSYYVINTISSGIAAIIFSLMLGFMLSTRFDFGFMTEEISFNIKKYLYFCTGAIIFGIGIQTPAAISISMEGKSFWIIKSSPIDYKKYLFSKILLSFIVLAPCSIISSTILVIFIDFDFMSIISIYLLPLLFVFLSSMLGLIINLKNYKFDWINEVDCIKHSSASYIALFSDWGITLLLFGSMIAFAFVNVIISQIIGLAILVILIIILLRYLYKNSNLLIERIEF